MKTENLHNINTYRFFSEFLVSIIVCFSLSACVGSHTNQVFPANGGKPSPEKAVNLNTASRAELESLPLIGESFAQKITEHREKYGKFRRAEHLLLIEGMSDRKFRQISAQIKVE